MLIHCIGIYTLAHDFETGGVYYSYVNKTSKTVKVSYQGTSYDSYDNEYTGSVTIPQTVQYSGVHIALLQLTKRHLEIVVV